MGNCWCFCRGLALWLGRSTAGTGLEVNRLHGCTPGLLVFSVAWTGWFVGQCQGHFLFSRAPSDGVAELVEIWTSSDSSSHALSGQASVWRLCVSLAPYKNVNTQFTKENITSNTENTWFLSSYSIFMIYVVFVENTLAVFVACTFRIHVFLAESIWLDWQKDGPQDTVPLSTRSSNETEPRAHYSRGELGLFSLVCW